jgi:hypothetical protein
MSAYLRSKGLEMAHHGAFSKPEGRQKVAHGKAVGTSHPERSPGTGRKNAFGKEDFRPVPGLFRHLGHSQGSRLGLLSFALRACPVKVKLALVGMP